MQDKENMPDATSQRTKAIDMGDYYLMNGTKNWITNGSMFSQYFLFSITKSLSRSIISCFDI